VADETAALLVDLMSEQKALNHVLRAVEGDTWFAATPAKGWDIRDTVAHLADTDEIAVDTCLQGRERPLNDFGATLASAEDLTLWGVLRGRRMTGGDVFAWWDRAAMDERQVLAGLDPSVRVPWGLGMRVSSFITARLMETWAHGLDIRAALGVDAPDTARLRNVAWLAIRALPYAFHVAGLEPPGVPIRFELQGPDGEEWTFGPADVPDVVRGDAGEFCRVFVQRLARTDATTLVAEGDAADAALDVARAYL
jgi:uncharacterized protein (TIGR03084 family)